MNEPVIFNATHPLVIRPTPTGFAIETIDGLVIAAWSRSWEHATVRLVPVPASDGDSVAVMLTVEWIEAPLDA